MRIFAYEVRPDEVDAFGCMARVYGADIELSSEVPNRPPLAKNLDCEGRPDRARRSGSPGHRGHATFSLLTTDHHEQHQNRKEAKR